MFQELQVYYLWYNFAAWRRQSVLAGSSEDTTRITSADLAHLLNGSDHTFALGGHVLSVNV